MTDAVIADAPEMLIHDILVDPPPDPDEGGSSSSLSEPGDRSADEEISNPDLSPLNGTVDDVDLSDTEAETERLEKTPHKQRNVVLSPANGILLQREGSREVEETKLVAKPIATSDISSDDSIDEEGVPSPSPSKKRKRGAQDVAKALRKTSRLEPDPKLSRASRTPTGTGSEESPEEETILSPDDADTTKPPVKIFRSSGRHRNQTLEQEGKDDASGLNLDQKHLRGQEDVAEGASSNGEEMDVDDAMEGEGADPEITAKNEENVIKKKSAMDSLSAIENCFATLRDKLFDERLAQCQDELALLERPTFVHPELVMMREIIDHRRDQKIQYEQTLLKFKLEALERESIAQKAQIHSQYIQTVGSIRDKSLSDINRDIHQTHRERRNCEADVPDFIYEYNPKRSQQITHQMAYNEEVSLLSGLAKYMGFPAAPDISRARAKEFESDRRLMDQNMAVAEQGQNALQNQPPMLRASLSAASTFGRLQSGAEDHFLQQNAWANPQHPAHQMHRQVSTLSRAETQSSTPTNQKVAYDSAQPQDSASIAAELPPEPGTSIPPIPSNGNTLRDAGTEASAQIIAQQTADATPSSVVEEDGGDVAARNSRGVDQPRTTFKNKLGHSASHLVNKGVPREGDSLSAHNAAAKSTQFLQSGGTSRSPPLARPPVIKAEESGQPTRRSPNMPTHPNSHFVDGRSGQTNIQAL